ncbi:BolA protein [Marinomonas sp. MED121]|uniref:BolA/IbaG family iron-sulfur metabolism protein n=1 Tax=Marinomonas sp. MED121 TaxID=314277 RepID=UPI0000690AAC|nr:BolA/IbaG family iron-sulfur metabolism protein [Marinomonas sp. MED121]EAQ65898.1 BolA protein [Marinomonas sp. MED121]
MIIEQQILQSVTEEFNIDFLNVKNESYMHNVPEGSESHFKLTLVSDDFAGKRLVQRHQMIYKLLAKQMDLIHALALHLYTVEEWQSRQSSAPLSPKCHGGE